MRKMVSILLLVVMPSIVSAAAYYVDGTSGNDSNHGSLTTPFKTINRGATELHPGDSLYIRAGVYPESLRNVIPSGSSWSAPVIVSAYSGETVILRPPVGAYRVLHFDGVGTQFISVEGLILDGANVGYDVAKITYSNNTDNHAHHIRIKNCEVKNSGTGQGVLVTGGGNSGNNEFIGLDVHNNGNTELTHGLYIASSNNIVENCRVHDNAGYGIQLYGSRGTVNNNAVRRNRVYNNGANKGVQTDKAGIIVSGGNGNIVHNNLVYGHKSGIRVDYNVTNTKVYNNTVYGRDSFSGGIYVGKSSTGAMVSNNLVFQTYPGNEIDNFGSSTIISNNLEGVDPKWTNAGNGDFHLQPNSPAIDAGAFCGILEDFEGNPIPSGNAPDIGAYEVQSCVVTVKQR
jgi:parallel beta-helix repeat protein